MSILNKAENLVNHDRQKDYDDPVSNFNLIARIASLITGKHLTAKDCVKVHMATKLARETYQAKEDNRIDLCGYVEILDRLEKS